MRFFEIKMTVMDPSGYDQTSVIESIMDALKKDDLIVIGEPAAVELTLTEKEEG